MVVYYIFFEVDNTNYKLCKEKKIYEGFNVIIPECKQKRNIYLERIGEIVESACKFEKKERISIEKVIEKLEKVIVSNKEFVD